MPTLLSVDIWDTLLRRRCHPDEVKLATARMLWACQRPEIVDRCASAWDLLRARVQCEAEIARERQAAGLDNEYAIEEVVARWLASVLRPRVGPAQRAALAEMLVLAEVDQEKLVVYPDRRMLQVLAHHEADRLVGLSDFYIGEARLRSIIEHACPDVRLQRVFVSCDALVNKMKGRLFAHAQREMLAQPEHHTHVGDNPWSDVESPRRFGIRAIHFLNPDEEPRRAAHRTRFDRRQRGDFHDTAQILTQALRDRNNPPPGLDPVQRQLFQIGFGAAPVYGALVLAAIHEAHNLGCPAVHYFTREGEFFKQVHEALAPTRPFGLPAPKPILLEVSRLATFLPSLREVTIREFMRLWNQYAKQSLEQLFRSLDVNPFPFEPLLARHGLELGAVLLRPWEDPRVRRLIADPLFVRLIEQQRDRRRQVAVEYFRSRGLGAGPAVTVDIGWRGSIQDNLAAIFPGCQFRGWYLGLVRLLNEQPPNTVKHAIGPDARSDPETLLQIVYNVSPLEMLANTNTGSVRRYERRADGRVHAVRTREPAEDAVWETYTRYFQQGVLAATPIIGAWARTFAVDPIEMRPLVTELLRTLKANPPRVLAEAYFSLTHNETFGVGGFVEKRPHLDPALVRLGEDSRGADPAFIAAVEASDWPQGLLKLLGHEELCRQYNTFREERAGRIQRRASLARVQARSPGRPHAGAAEPARPVEGALAEPKPDLVPPPPRREPAETR
ncbi:MAG: HAD family hydrolase [Phycisphaerales bacterium]|nr:HAD family hydrolase [Phycisphaerales bacterium]